MVVIPGATPTTFPEELIVAIAVELLLHVPAVSELLLRLIKAPTQTALGPLIVPASATGLTLIFADAVAFPQLPEMV